MSLTTQHWLTALPTPVALAYRVVNDDQATPRERWTALFNTAEQLMRVAALPLLGAYLRSSPAAAPKLNNALLGMRLPDFSKWRGLLDSLARHKTLLQPLFPEFFDAYARAIEEERRCRMDVRPEYGMGRKVKKHTGLTLLEGFHCLRNYAHHTDLTQAKPKELDNQFQADLAKYTPHLERLLQAFEFLTRFSICVQEAGGDPGRCRIFRGCDPEMGSVAGLSAPFPGVVVTGPSGQPRLLSPFARVGGDAESLSLFDGFSLEPNPTPGSDRLIFQGRQRFDDFGPATPQELRQLLAGKAVNLLVEVPKITPWQLSEVLRSQSQSLLETIRATSCREETYLDRPDLSERLFHFATADSDARPGVALLLTGLAGVGKSVLLADLAARVLKQNDDLGRDDVILYLRGDSITAGPEEQHVLFGRLTAIVGLKREDRPQFPEMLAALDRLLPYDLQIDRKVVFLLDGVNEARQPERVMGELLDLIEAAQQYPWMRVVFSVREEFLEVMRDRLGSMQADPLAPVRHLLYAPDPGTPYCHPSLPVWVVPGLMPEEAERIYDLYQQTRRADERDGKPRRDWWPACLTPWCDLPAAIRGELLTRPLYLHLWMRAFDGREARGVETRDELFSAYLERVRERFPTFAGRVLARILIRMLVLGKQTLDHEDEQSLQDEGVGFSQLDAAVTSGMFIRFEEVAPPGRRYSFFHQRLGEVVVARHLEHHSEQFSPAVLERWKGYPRTELLTGGVEVLGTRLIDSARYSDAFQLLDAFDFQMSPRNSWLFSAGRVRSSVAMRKTLHNHLNDVQHKQRNLYQLGLAYYRLAQPQDAQECFRQVLGLGDASQRDELSAAVLIYQGIAVRKQSDMGQSRALLLKACDLARGVPIQANALGHLAWTEYEAIQGNGDDPPPKSFFGRLARRAALYLRVVRRLRRAIVIVGEPPRDERIAVFWRACLGKVYLDLDANVAALRELETAWARCQNVVHDAHCQLYINFWLGQAYCASYADHSAGRALLHQARTLAARIGDGQRQKEIERELEKWK
jgi:hypothetical protein